MKINYLSQVPQYIPNIAQWYFDEWGYLKKHSTVLSFIQDLKQYLNPDKIPLMLVAMEQDIVLGAVQLKYREMSIYPNYEHWIGGVFVWKYARGKETAEKMITKLLKVAKSLSVKTLYLQTERLNGGLYAKLGWEPIEQVNYRGIDVLVMQKTLSV